MAPKKLKQISNYHEKFNGSSLSILNKRNKPKNMRTKKTEDILTSIIMILTDMFSII